MFLTFRQQLYITTYLIEEKNELKQKLDNISVQSKFCRGSPEYTGLQSHFRSANNTVFILSSSSKSNQTRVVVARGRIETMVKVNNKTMSTVLSFIPILYLKEQSNILWCLWDLRFEKLLYSNKLLSYIFRSKRIVYTVKKVQQSILFKTVTFKTFTFFYAETVA